MPLPFADAVTFLPVAERAEPPPLRSFTVRYLRAETSLAQVESWCESVGLWPAVVEGPCLDGTFRGTCVIEGQPPGEVHDGAAPAASPPVHAG